MANIPGYIYGNSYPQFYNPNIDNRSDTSETTSSYSFNTLNFSYSYYV